MTTTAQTQSDDVTVSTKTDATVQTQEVETGNSTPVDGVRTPDAFDNDIAIRPNAPQDIPALLSKVSKLGATYAENEDEDARAEYLDAARHLVYALETPREAMIRYCWSQSTLYAAIETCVNLGVFVLLSRDDTPKTAAGLATATNADPLVLSRLLKHLSTMGVIAEAGEDTYRRNGFSTSLSNKRYSDAYPCMTNCITYGITSLPSFLKKTNYANPSDGCHAAFQDGYRTDKHFFEFLKEHPAYGEEFNNHMTAYHQGRPSWMDEGFYPVPSLTEGLNIAADDVLLVDVGGNVGHDLSEFRRKWPNIPGRLILQDLPEVIEQAKWQNQATRNAIEPMSHDFFTEQPVKGARAYYMHSVLHDWADADCRRILSNLVPAMERGYSKILINENVIPSTNAYWETTSLDIIMMADFASQERTEKQWHALVESVGLRIVKIWTRRRGVESLIECELA
ncbi:S-adenosyl-L-methionine-dependent methyltransferase [Aspergillus recurvatus]